MTSRKKYHPVTIRPLAHATLGGLKGELHLNGVDVISFALVGLFSLDKLSRSKIIRSGQLLSDVFHTPKESLFLQAINEIEQQYVVINRETYLALVRYVYEVKDNA